MKEDEPMRLKRPRVASLDEVRITRTDTAAVIEFADPQISTTHLQIGPEVQEMSDEEILALFNDGVEARDDFARNYDYVAVEIPPGRPQIEYRERCDQWTARGGVLRCVIDDGGPDGEPTFHIDDQELSLREFGRLLVTYAGWGMRVVFVPDDEVHESPRIEVRQPEEEEPPT
jgi:hypothetical protein